MAISDRISSIEEHIKESYQELEGIGIDTTGVNKNLENIPKLIDGYWETLPKVQGTGETITLDNTVAGKMKINLKGNTSQETTTGKNLFNIEGQYETGTGITFTKNNDGSYTLNGTANGNNFLRGLCYLNEQHTISYSSSTANSNVIIRTRTGTPTAQTGIQDQLFVSTTSGNLTSSKQFDFVEISIVSGTTLNNFKIYIQLEKGSSVTTFEPYTNGASPNPDYPQDIHVVSGNNDINICGKNLLNIANWVKGRINNTTGNIEYANNVSSMVIGENNISFVVSQVWNSGIASDFIPISTGTYTFTFSHNREISVYIDTYKNQNERLSRVVSYTDSASPTTRTFTISDSNVKYIRIHFEVNTANVEYIVSEMQLEKGSTATTYEPYQGNTYNVDLPVENVLNLGNVSGTSNQVQYSINSNGELVLNGTCNSDRVTIDLPTQQVIKGKYTFSTNYLKATALKNGNGDNLFLTTSSNGVKTETINDTITQLVIYGLTGVSFNNQVIKLMVEKGSKQNAFTPYGTTPIELCKIGDYQDRIFKSSGKNLFDKEAITSNTYITASGETGTSSVSNLTDYIQVKANQQYCLYYTYSTLASSNNRAMVYYDENKNYVSGYDYSPSSMPKTFTPLQNGYVRLAYDVNAKNMQLEKGGSFTSYEPYGNGEWYLKKEIGEKTLVGTENWQNTFGESLFGTNLSDKKVNVSSLAYSNYYTLNNRQSGLNTGLLNGEFTIQIGTTDTLYFKNTDYTTTSGFKTWLSTHNTIVYYVLANPTYTEITDSTLISQLDTIKRSYDEQTNISQENNDLSFELTASALLDVNTQINHLEAQIEALS